MCLTKPHGMKVYSVLNRRIRHEDVLESGGLAPHVLNLGARWKSVVNFTNHPLYTRGNGPGNHCVGGCVAPEPVWTRWRREKIPALAGKRKPVVHRVA